MGSHFKTLLIIDFETSCDPVFVDYPNEIIQFSAAVVDVATKSLVSDVHFNKYVRPVINPILSDFCTEFTGIEQEMVDNADTFDKVIHEFFDFLNKNKFYEKEFVVVCDSRQDMFRIAQWQFRYSGFTMPAFFRQYVNLWRTFEWVQDTYGKKELFEKTNIGKMCEYYGIDFSGRAHDALDDCKTIGLVVQRMLRDGMQITVNEELVCVAQWRKGPLTVSENWKKDFKEVMKVYERFLPLVPSVVRRGSYSLENYNCCRYCQNPSTVCGRKHKQYPHYFEKDNVEFARHVNYFK